MDTFDNSGEAATLDFIPDDDYALQELELEHGQRRAEALRYEGGWE